MQKIVQSCHAVHESGLRCTVSQTGIVDIILLTARNTGELLMTYVELQKKYGIEAQLFYDSDLDEYTSLATEPLDPDRRHPLRKYHLMKE